MNTMKVGKKYFVRGNKFEEFCEECRNSGVPSIVYTSFQCENFFILKSKAYSGLEFKNLYGIWYYSEEAIRFFIEVSELKQEEMDI